MKKIYFILMMLVLGNTSYSQDFYNFSRTERPYQDLVNATKVSGDSAYWFVEQELPIQLPMDVSVFGHSFNMFFLSLDFLNFVNEDFETSENIALFKPFNGYIIDRAYTAEQNNLALSSISYLVEGEVGNRILKLEVKNFGSLVELVTINTTEVYINYQFWYYENTGKIEIHYGPHNITDLSLLSMENNNSMLFGSSVNGDINVGTVSGTIPNEVYIEAEEENFLNAMTPPNTVYVFDTETTASNNKNEVLELKLYPNPTDDILSIEFKENVSDSYAIYDVSGKEVMTGKIDNELQFSISVTRLVAGTYVLKIGTSHQKFVKK